MSCGLGLAWPELKGGGGVGVPSPHSLPSPLSLLQLRSGKPQHAACSLPSSPCFLADSTRAGRGGSYTAGRPPQSGSILPPH